VHGRTLQSASGSGGASVDRKRTPAVFRANRHGLGHGTIATACHGFEIHWRRPVSEGDLLAAGFTPKNELMILAIKLLLLPLEYIVRHCCIAQTNVDAA
jgi:hypothetical protein